MWAVRGRARWQDRDDEEREGQHRGQGDGRHGAEVERGDVDPPGLLQRGFDALELVVPPRGLGRSGEHRGQVDRAVGQHAPDRLPLPPLGDVLRENLLAIGRHVAEKPVRQRHDRLVLVGERPVRPLGDPVGVVGEDHAP